MQEQAAAKPASPVVKRTKVTEKECGIQCDVSVTCSHGDNANESVSLIDAY